jgi:hypothetical protein
MSNAAQDPTADALQTITSDVYLPAFAEKCAAAGLQFPDNDSLNAALESVAMLKAAEKEESTDLTKQARADLGRLLGEPEVQATEEETQKSASLAGSERVRNAFATLAAQPAQ